MAEDFDFDGNFGNKDPDTGSSGSSGERSTKEYNPYAESVADLILTALEQEGGELTWPVRADDADPIPDDMREYFGLPDDVTHFCIEQVAPFDIDTDHVGTKVNVSYEQLQESVEQGLISAEALEDMDVEPGESIAWEPEDSESTPQTDLAMCLNGFYADEIVERFGDDAKVRVMTRKKTKAPSAHDRFNHVRFYVSDSATAAFSRERARVTVGELAQSEFAQWAEDNGYAEKLE